MTLLLILNAYHDAVKFKLPKVVGGRNWAALLDTNQPEVGRFGRSKLFPFAHEYLVTGRSLLLFRLARESHGKVEAPGNGGG